MKRTPTRDSVREIRERARSGDLRGAAEAARKAIANSALGSDAEAVVELQLVAAYCVMRQGQHGEALRALDAAAQAATSTPRASMLALRVQAWRAELAYFQGRYSAADEIADRVLAPLEAACDFGYVAFVLRTRIAILLARADYEGQGTAYAASPGPYGPEPRGQRPGQYADFRFGHPLSQRERDEARHARHDEGRNFLDRAADRVASWFGGHEGETRAAPTWQGHRGKGPRGYHRSDQRISDDVHDALTDDAYLDATDVTVAVASGEVTLSGVVTDREAKHRAERIVERISGVDHVQNNLRIGHVEGSKPFAGGNPLTTPGRGFGDSVLEAQARGETPRTVDDDDRSH